MDINIGTSEHVNDAERLIRENEELKQALHDAILRPMGVVPESAEKFYDPKRFEFIHGEGVN